MKTNRKIWKRISLVLILSVVTTWVFLISCEKENIQPNDTQLLKSTNSEYAKMEGISGVCGDVQRLDLLIGNETKIGNVYFYNDIKFLYVYVVALKERSLKNAYMFIGLKGEVPLTRNGDPDFNQFNHIAISQEWINTKRFKIPLSELPRIFVVSMMVESKPSYTSTNGPIPSVIQKSWTQGKLYGNTVLGSVFGYSRVDCPVVVPIDTDLHE